MGGKILYVQGVTKMGEDIEKIFKNEVREKKTTGYGASKRASRKKGFKGTMKMPFDLLSNKEKRELLKGGEIVEYNMYEKLENLPSKDKILNMPPEMAYQILTVAKSKFSSKEISKKLGYSSNSGVFSLFKKFKVAPYDDPNYKGTSRATNKKDKRLKANRGKNQEPKNNDNDQIVLNVGQPASIIQAPSITAPEYIPYIPQPISQSMPQQQPISQQPVQYIPKQDEDDDSDGIQLRYKGKYNGDKIKLDVLSLIDTIADDSKYQIKLIVKEIEE